MPPTFSKQFHSRNLRIFLCAAVLVLGLGLYGVGTLAVEIGLAHLRPFLLKRRLIPIDSSQSAILVAKLLSPLVSFFLSKFAFPVMHFVLVTTPLGLSTSFLFLRINGKSRDMSPKEHGVFVWGPLVFYLGLFALGLKNYLSLSSGQ